jgi:acyl-CoA synthetase (AMP-forming)/AMP-acid ligase II
MRLIDCFDRGAEAFPDRAFLVGADGQCSYAEAQRRSHQLAQAIHELGAKPGSKAAVLSANAVPAFECVLGIVRAGLVWVPLNVRNTVEECAHTLQLCEVEVLFFQQAVAATAAELGSRCPLLKRLVCIDGDAPAALSLAALLQGCDTLLIDVPQSDDTVVTLFSSGGTTGLPKAVMMTNRCWSTMSQSSQQLLAVPHIVHLVAAPMTHAAGGSALAYAALGATNIMLPGFEPLAVMQAIERHRVTHLFLPPTAIYRLLAHSDVERYDYSSLRYFIYASAPMSVVRLREAVRIFGPVMCSSFGQSETGLNGTFLAPQEVAAAVERDDEARLGSVGRAGPAFRVAIMDEIGELQATGTAGEIVMQSEQLFVGYYRNDAETQASRLHGWHHTGDIGVLDEAGYLTIVDRKKDMIITGGFNVFPAEVERALLEHPAVQDCAVVGMPDAEWGERVTAVVELKRGADVDDLQLLAHCRARLSGVKSPKCVIFDSALPRSPAGKVLRRVVRERLRAH